MTRSGILSGPVLQGLMGVLILWALTIVPARPAGVEAFAHLPLEVPLVVLCLAVLSLRAARVLAGLVALIAGGVALLHLADLGMYLAFQRSFNPVIDAHLIGSGWELASRSFGPIVTAFAVLLVALIAALILWLCARGLGALSRWPRVPLAAAAALVLGIGLLAPGLTGARTGFTVTSELRARATRFSQTLHEETRFVQELRRPEIGPTPDFAALAGRDIYVIFVESYGRSWLDAPVFRDAARGRLSAVQDRLTEAGFASRSTWMASPTRGGQSWLAHATALSGLWVSGQPRYDALIGSDRASLNAMFRAAGWETLGVMPAISRAWPEARWYGYDVMKDAKGLGYHGQPFDWVTMPDQFTLARSSALVAAADRPVMVEAALISSHAPWTPQPEILPWDQIGDGSVFDGTRRSGAPPSEVWANPDSIRAAYARALDYTMEVLGQWIARSGDDALIVVLGDHQPAPLVAGEDASAAVPVHLIARDPALLARFSGAWSDGMLPADALPERPMSDLRGLIARCLSTGGCAPSPQEGL
ncbi:sulfatase [Thioclava dalianensis]|uniref:Sulfatase n=1 Tax=Thioclava dalianensis TaxID=1185766 RepID=A0A074T8Q8_9RHOB|nr:hypothetical protein [Thioclava dalianensis]KEP68109.1 sulfatase [Thioclava dalianensis]SFN39031.1 hypothetical protein SAMN05216224_1055 [Thioclava dalianensis]